MQIIINIFLFCAKISEKAIYWRPFWNSLIPYKIHVFFISKSLRLTMIQFNLWYVLRRALYSVELYDESYSFGKKQDALYINNINGIADMLPGDVKRDFIEDML